MILLNTVETIVQQWNLCLKIIRPDIDLHGSPERSLYRVAFEDEIGEIFVLEQIACAQKERKYLISKILDQLHAEGLNQVIPYLRSSSGKSQLFYEGTGWQVSLYIRGTALDRPGYIQDAPKGEALARFLCNLARHAKSLSHDLSMPPFSLKLYILKLEKEMMQYDPDVGRRFANIFDSLRQSFMKAHDTVPMAFCHGDYHPLNIIWQGNGIEAVIDWEFCGLKPDLYDAANLVGCIGMEHPSGLNGDLVLSFINAMRKSPVISAQSWNMFGEFVIALRFAWLAEWLRNKDKKMIDLEEDYMNLLQNNMEELKKAWGISNP
jgi:homoserine kinase type II